MKLLTAALTALVTLGFAGAVAAAGDCGGYSRAAQTAEAPILLPDGSAGS